MLPPGNLIVSLYFRSFRLRVPPRPRSARETARLLREHPRRGRRRRDSKASAAASGAASASAAAPAAAPAAAAAATSSESTGAMIDKDELAPLEAGGGGGEDDGKGEGKGEGGDNLVESWLSDGGGGGEDEDEDDGDGERHELYDDIYSMLFLSHWLSASAIYALFTFGLKMMFFSFLITDLLTGNPEGNFFGAPAGISNMVRTAQFFMLPVAVAMQEDLIGSIFLFNVHYEDRIQVGSPGATKCKWVISSALRLMDGMYSLFVNFCLLLTSNSVLGLFLNFAALAFLQTVDNVAYELALQGYLNESIEACAKIVSEKSLPKWGRGFWGIMDSVCFLLIFITITIVWVIVTVKQIRGDFLCQTISATFGADLAASYGSTGFFDGPYDKVGTLTIAMRAVYEHRRVTDSTPQKGVFAYCGDRQYWTFIVTEKDPYALSGPDVCYYDLRSPEVPDNYDISAIPPSDWFYRRGGLDVPVDEFNLWCSACESADDCSGHGSCQDHQCVCQDGYYGESCQFGSGSRSAGGGGGGSGSAAGGVFGAGEGAIDPARGSGDEQHAGSPHLGEGGSRRGRR